LTEDFPALAGFRPGSLVAGYRLEEQVGAGGMAVVFRAHDERLGRLVALKLLAPALAADEGFRRRFIAESRAAAAVDDPHIIPVYEAGEASGVLFIAMRFVAGGDLRRVLTREGPLSPGRAASFISPVASALDAAHRAGLVHRDVKPANILVDSREDRPDHVYLSDFGVSKGALSSVSLTGTGQFLGTPEYSAPEQVQGRTQDGRADQYALACVAYQLLTGSPPFERDQGLAVLLAHLSEPPPLMSSRRPGLPAAANEVLARALAKDPEERYRSCRDFAEALRGALGLAPYSSIGLADALGHPATEIAAPRAESPQPDPAGPAKAADPPGPAAPETIDAVPRSDDPPQRAQITDDGVAAPRSTPSQRDDGARPARYPRRRLVAIALACAVLIAAGVTASLLAIPGSPPARRPPGSSAASHSPGSPSHTKVTAKGLAATLTDPGNGAVNSVALSPNGTMLAAGDENGSTYLWNVATKSVTGTLTDPDGGGANSVAFSPNGALLAVGDQNGSTYLWNVATKSLAATVPGTSGYSVESVAFSPNGALLAVGNANDAILLWNVTTKSLAANILDPNYYPVSSVAFSPNGSTLAVGASGSNTYLLNVATESWVGTLTDPAGNGPGPVVFSPNGTLLAVGDLNGSTYLWNVGKRSLAATFPTGSGYQVNAVAFSPNGTLLAVGDLNGSTYLWNLATHRLTATLTVGPRPADGVAFDPRGAMMAVGESDGKAYLWKTSRY
jgi:serine/threonine protein kinase